ncbi:Hypothetical protein CAP_0830 [Chondromyces apiculatus DSM 436]|uniref:Uncharacterized protein n=1 Tax=Chondromyces apiculatus DSM 436 TaxID=1192034 RepID=A0A017STW2_9BACT|nr:Hypothetical protein CAP_0830 [Chondromyces apiculatus DSM 436]
MGCLWSIPAACAVHVVRALTARAVMHRAKNLNVKRSVRRERG